MGAKNVTPLRPVLDPAPFAGILQSITHIAAQCAVCASAAWAISEDSEGTRPKHAMAAMPAMLDGMREQLEQLAGEIEARGARP